MKGGDPTEKVLVSRSISPLALQEPYAMFFISYKPNYVSTNILPLSVPCRNIDPVFPVPTLYLKSFVRFESVKNIYYIYIIK